MKLFSLLRKPDWESKNASVRERAVARGDEPELLAKLAEFAQADPEPAVRIAALRRIDDLALLERRLRGERESAVAAAARERLFQLLDGGPAEEAQRAGMVAQLLDDALLQRLLESARSPLLRRAALQRLDKASYYVDRCIHDADAALRLWALEHVDEPDALKRIAEAVRKRDKRLTRAARDKLDAIAVAAGSPEALQRAALDLCERISRLARELPADREQQLASLRAAWQTLAPRVDADIQRRAEGCLAMADAALAGARGEGLPKADPTPVEATEPQAPVAPPPARSAELDVLVAEVAGCDDAAALDALLERVDAVALETANPVQQEQREVLQRSVAERRRQLAEDARQRRREADAEQWEQAFAALRTALDAGNLASARLARQQLAEAKLPAAWSRRLPELDAELEQLGRWQRWSGNKVRGRLCDEAEALHGSGLHPDAVANKVKDLQAEWQRLDALDGPAAPGPEHGLNRRFRALCQRALAPARPYFEKRNALRAQRGAEIDRLLADSAVLPADATALRGLRARVVEALRDLDGVPAAQRGERGRALREKLAAIDAAQSDLRDQAMLEKRRLIARLRRDLSASSGADAIDLAKAAQAEWKRLPRASRETDDALWTELRSLIDPLFAGQREDAARDRAEQDKQLAQARIVIDELEALAAADAERLQHAAAHLEGIAQRWRGLNLETPAAPPPATRGEPRGRPAPRRAAPRHPLQDAYDRAVAKVDAAQRAARQQREASAIEALLAAGELLDQHDPAQAESWEAAWQALALEPQARDSLLSALQDGRPSLPTEDVQRLLVKTELLAGIESPPEAQALRRQEQMRRLAAKLEGDLEPPAATLLPELLLQLQSHRLPADVDRATCLQRWQRAWQVVSRPA